MSPIVVFMYVLVFMSLCPCTSASLHGLAVGSLWYRSQPSADEERRSAFLLHLSPTYYGIKTGAS